MSAVVNGQPDVAAIVEQLTGPGGEFEVVREDVLGAPTQVFAHRRRSLSELLSASLRHGEREYLVTETERLTFTEHADRVASFARALHDTYGVRKGDRVALLAANSAHWIIGFWATVALGAIAVGYNSWWSPREVRYALEHTTPRVVLTDAKRAPLLGDAEVTSLSMEEDVPQLSRAHSGAPLPQVEVAEDDPAAIIYTSGTSGRPKGAVHSHRNLLAVCDYQRYTDALAAAFGDPLTATDRRHLLALPLFHIATLHNLTVPRLDTGGTIVLYEGKFEADRVLTLIERERVTNWGAVPTMAHRLLEHGDLERYDLSSLSAFSLATAPSSPALHERLRAALPKAGHALANSYGLTETSTAVAVATAQDLAVRPDTLGHPIVTVELEIRDPLGEPVPDGEEGEVCVQSPFVMLGYWDDPAATAASIREGRWLHTGDLGVREDGRIRLVSRRSDLILRGGENVYPAEVEWVLAELAGVRECLVVGVPHEDLGQEVGAVVVHDEATPLGEEQLTAHARENLAYYKVPRRWRITTEPLPRNATGKVLRTQVPPL